MRIRVPIRYRNIRESLGELEIALKHWPSCSLFNFSFSQTSPRVSIKLGKCFLFLKYAQIHRLSIHLSDHYLSLNNYLYFLHQFFLNSSSNLESSRQHHILACGFNSCIVLDFNLSKSGYCVFHIVVY